MSVKFRDNFDDIRERVSHSAGVIAYALAGDVVEEAQALMPRDSGEMHDKTRVRGVNQHAADAVSEAGHAAHNNYGTTSRPGEFWWERAIETVRQRAADKSADILREGLK
jgi:hypothetical protein